MSGIDTGLWGGMLSAMSVVVGFQLFFIQHWLSGCSALESEADPIRDNGPGDAELMAIAERMRVHKDSYPKLTTFVMSSTVVLFCALSVVVGVQIGGIPVILTVLPGIGLLVAFLVVTVASWLQGTRRMDRDIERFLEPAQPHDHFDDPDDGSAIDDYKTASSQDDGSADHELSADDY